MTAAEKTFRLENPYVWAELDPGRGGAVTGLFYKKAVSFPLISDRGSGFAGSGALFAPWVEVAGAPVENWRAQIIRRAARSVGLKAELARGLAWERKIRLETGASGLSVKDVFRNRTGNVVKVRIGMNSRQENAEWRLTGRCWIGDATRCSALATSNLPVPGQIPPPPQVKMASKSFFWRQIGQYGTGLLYRARRAGYGTVSAEVLPGDYGAVQVSWRSAEISLPPRGQVGLEAEVLADEGGGAPDQENAFAPVLLRSDFAAAGRRGEPVTGFVTVVSDRRRQVRIALERVLALPGSLCKTAGTTRSTFDLIPGKVARLPVIFTPAAGGRWILRATAAERGQTIAAAESLVLIDGNSRQAAWRAYLGKMPEEHYHGSWEEIGVQIARNRRRIGGPTSIEYAVRENAAPDNDISFYERYLPFYAGMVAGVAKAVGAPPKWWAWSSAGSGTSPGLAWLSPAMGRTAR